MAQSRPNSKFRTIEEEIAAKLDAYLKTMHQKDFEEIIENIKKKNTPASSFWNIFSKPQVEKDVKFDEVVQGLSQHDILSQSMLVVETQKETTPSWNLSDKFWGALGYTAPVEPVKKPKSIKKAISDLIKEDDKSTPWTETSPNTQVLRELIKKIPDVDPVLDLNLEFIRKVRLILSQRLIQAQKAIHAEVLKKDSFNSFTIMEKLANERKELIAKEGIRPKKHVPLLNTTSDHEKELLAEANRLREEAKLLCEQRQIIEDELKHQENYELYNEAKELCAKRDVKSLAPQEELDLTEQKARLGEAQNVCKNREIPVIEPKEEKREVSKKEISEVCKTNAEIRAKLNSLFSGSLPDVVQKSRDLAKKDQAPGLKINLSRG